MLKSRESLKPLILLGFCHPFDISNTGTMLKDYPDI